MYVDGASADQAERVDFGDWAGQSKPRNVVFAWPNGTALNDTAEGYVDDFNLLAPTRQPGPAGKTPGHNQRNRGAAGRTVLLNP